ncbi:MAG: hypothetical protein EPO19_04400 [Betaproteobacteria bacterium]|nr:MAG: hypothetical protein EPO19_04400 [Betaproteobacteria bacterium]
MVEQERFVVITSINRPSEAIYEFARWSGWHVIVVGDRKTPEGWQCDGVTYLGIDQQYDEFPELASAIPENTYTRKMLGYLYAMQRGATTIFETDDDNIPYRDAAATIGTLLSAADRASGERIKSDAGWVNIYANFGAPRCWPRGFPIEYINQDKPSGQEGFDRKPWGVMQFLADADPDVDAIYRIVSGEPVYFSRQKMFFLEEGTFCPFNSQATLWLSEAFPLMFFPLGVSDRVTDILRGYLALACLWKHERTVAYSSPIVYQKRNKHDLLRDFQQEIPIYQNADAWSRRLKGLGGTNAAECFRMALATLCSDGSISSENIHLYEQFLLSASVRRRKTIVKRCV